MNLINLDSSASVLALLLSNKYPTTELTQPAKGAQYTASGKTQQKTPLPTVSLLLWAVA
jgi:hypothetical protein